MRLRPRRGAPPGVNLGDRGGVERPDLRVQQVRPRTGEERPTERDRDSRLVDSHHFVAEAADNEHDAEVGHVLGADDHQCSVRRLRRRQEHCRTDGRRSSPRERTSTDPKRRDNRASPRLRESRTQHERGVQARDDREDGDDGRESEERRGAPEREVLFRGRVSRSGGSYFYMPPATRIVAPVV